jgi:putative spermidine/putrescine transport system permease protein
MSFSTSLSFQFPPPGYWLGYYRQYVTDPNWLYPTLNSFVIAGATMLVTLVLVLPAAFALVRHRFRGKSALNLLLMTPMIVPLVVSALGYYNTFGRLGLAGTHAGMILAHSALAVPGALLAITAALKGFDVNLERAAMSAGAGPLRTFWWVTLPVLRPGILVGALFAFLSSFDETVVALFLAGRQASTLPKKMFESVRLETDPVISVVSTLLFTLVVLGSLVAVLVRTRSGRAA